MSRRSHLLSGSAPLALAFGAPLNVMVSPKPSRDDEIAEDVACFFANQGRAVPPHGSGP